RAPGLRALLDLLHAGRRAAAARADGRRRALPARRAATGAAGLLARLPRRGRPRRGDGQRPDGASRAVLRRPPDPVRLRAGPRRAIAPPLPLAAPPDQRQPAGRSGGGPGRALRPAPGAAGGMSASAVRTPPADLVDLAGAACITSPRGYRLLGDERT